MRTTRNRRLLGSKRRRLAERGVALVLVMIFLALMLLLGLATTMTSITEVNVGANYRLSTDAFDVADAGASHGYELVRNMKGDFTYILRGNDGDLRTGDEFNNKGRIKTYKNDGTIRADDPGVNFDTTKVTVIEEQLGADGYTRALHQIDARHFYELIAYDNAHDTRAWLAKNQTEDTNDTLDSPTTDCDQRILIRSIGYIMGEDTTKANFRPENAIASAVVDVVVGLTPYPAIITENDLTIQNGVEIRGTLGAVHSNDNLTLGGGSWFIEQSATFSNDDTGDSDAGSNSTADSNNVQGFNGPAGRLFIPDINVFDASPGAQYIAKNADFIAVTGGASDNLRTALVTAMGGNAATVMAPYLAAGTACVITNDLATPPVYTVVQTTTGSYSTGTGAARFEVDVKSNDSVVVGDIPTAPPAGTFVTGKGLFVLMPEGSSTRDVHLNVPDGQLTLMTNGSVLLNGNCTIRPSKRIVTPNAPPWNSIDLLVLCGEDLTMNGTAGAGNEIEGVIYAHEQFDLSGSGYITGQVVGYDLDLVWDSATSNYKSNTAAPPASRVLTNPGGSMITTDSIVRGNFEVNHNTSTGYIGNFAQSAWRQLRDFHPVNNARIVP